MKNILQNLLSAFIALSCLLLSTFSSGNEISLDSLTELKEYRDHLQEIENYIYELDDPNKVIIESRNGDLLALDRVSFEEMVYKNYVQKAWDSSYHSFVQMKEQLSNLLRGNMQFYYNESERIKKQLRIIKDGAVKRKYEVIRDIGLIETGQLKKKVDLSSNTGTAVFEDNFDSDTIKTIYNFDKFKKWDVDAGDVDYVRDGTGAFIDMDGTTTWGETNQSSDNGKAGKLMTKKSIDLKPGNYSLKFRVRGNPDQGKRVEYKDNPNKLKVSLGSVKFDDPTKAVIQMKHGTGWKQKDLNFKVQKTISAKLVFDHTIVDGDWYGLYLDDVRIIKY